MIKVVDACGLAGFDNFWVFATGLTNVEVTLDVVDTWTGDQRIYRNASIRLPTDSRRWALRRVRRHAAVRANGENASEGWLVTDDSTGEH